MNVPYTQVSYAQGCNIFSLFEDLFLLGTNDQKMLRLWIFEGICRPHTTKAKNKSVIINSFQREGIFDLGVPIPHLIIVSMIASLGRGLPRDGPSAKVVAL